MKISQILQTTAARLAAFYRVFNSNYFVVAMLCICAVLLLVKLVILPQMVSPHTGRWSILKSKSCFAMTRLGSDSLAFRLAPKPTIILTVIAWKNTAGSFPLGIEFGSTAGKKYILNVTGIVLPSHEGKVLVYFSKAQDLEESMRGDWASFTLEGQPTERFNTGATEAIRMLSVCKT